MRYSIYLTQIILFLAMMPTLLFANQVNENKIIPVIRTTEDINIGETIQASLSNGESVSIRLHKVLVSKNSLNSGVQSAEITVSVDGQQLTLPSGNYNLPVKVGKVYIDCPVVKAYYEKSKDDPWKLTKDARIRLWPINSSFINPDTFQYPLKQRWMASNTQMGNEPIFANGLQYPKNKLYYHDALDFGGVEGMDKVIAPVDGLVLSAGKKRIDGYKDYPTFLNNGVIYMLDNRGWIFSFNHLHSINPEVKPGAYLKKGQEMGTLGKAGFSGGWTHLHMKIRVRQPSGKWASEDPYPYVWEAYQREYQPKVIAIARPHHLVKVGETVTLNGLKSWNATSYEWSLSNGKNVTGAIQTISYDRPGQYSEILKVSNNQGNIDYDFAPIQVVDENRPIEERVSPSIHGAFYPSLNVKTEDAVTFSARSFNIGENREQTWDFGDGTPPIVKPQIKSGYTTIVHSFEKAGHYIVSVFSSNESGDIAKTHLHVVVK